MIPVRTVFSVAPSLLSMSAMNKQQDAETHGERIDVTEVVVDDGGLDWDDRAPLFETDDDIFDHDVIEDRELDYEPEGTFLD